MFSGVRDPNAENLLYGVYTQLSQHDVDTRELVNAWTCRAPIAS